MQQPFGSGPYGPPNVARGRPAVIAWFRVYAAATVLLYLGAASASWRFLSGSLAFETLLVGAIVTLAFGAFYAVAAMVPYKPWGWTLGLIAICIGLSSLLAPVAVPLLLFWTKPETKAAFCRL